MLWTCEGNFMLSSFQKKMMSLNLNSWWQLGKLGKLRHLHRDLRGWNPAENSHVHKPCSSIWWCRLFWILHQFPDMQHKPLPKYVYRYCHLNLSFLPMSKSMNVNVLIIIPIWLIHLSNIIRQYLSHITWLTIYISCVFRLYISSVFRLTVYFICSSSVYKTYFVCILHLYLVCILHLFFVCVLHLYFVCLLHLYFVCI